MSTVLAYVDVISPFATDVAFWYAGKVIVLFAADEICPYISNTTDGTKKALPNEGVMFDWGP